MMKQPAPTILNFIERNKYSTEDLTSAEKAYLEKITPKKRYQREDLGCGNIVVILEGMYTGKKAVYIKRSDNYHVVVSGVTQLNGFGSILIDERFLLKLDMPKINLKIANFDEKNLQVSTVDDKPEEEISDSNTSAIEKEIISSLSNVKFLKSYFSENFVVDHSTEFYSMRY